VESILQCVRFVARTIALLVLVTRTVAAQGIDTGAARWARIDPDTGQQPKLRLTPVGLGPSDRTLYTAAGVAFVAAIALDHPARTNILATRTPFLDRLAPIGNTMGLAQYTVPTVATAFAAGNLIGRLTHHPRLADAATHLALSYVVADVSASIIRFPVGRQRPSYANDMDNFHPFGKSDEWQSFPSGHVTHIGAIAAAVAEEARTPWVTGLASAAVTLTAWQRIYADKHWASDVVAGAIVAVAASRLTSHWLRHKVPARS
jgi:membrane-associated phospholipid phosphatase